MTKEQVFKIGLDLNHIAVSLDETSYNRLKPYLEDIEKIVKEIYESEVDDNK